MVGAPVKPTVPQTPIQPPKPRPETPKREGGAKRNGRPGALICGLISVWIVWHFSAIFIAAMCIPGPSSPLAEIVAENPKSPMFLYLNALYLNQGHSFFAPTVGPGHVLHYEYFDASNQRLGDGTLPDKKEHWPRLLYHRYMMLADQLDMMAGDKAANDAHRKAYLEAFGRQLLRNNRSAQAVRVQLFAHFPLPSNYVLMGREAGYQRLSQDMAREGDPHQLNEQGYELEAEAVQHRSDLPQEPQPAAEPQKQSFAPVAPPNRNLNWQNERSNVANRWQGGPRR
ncbi:MAG TPA: hypothetical protein VHU84_17470 [Lacipirellulaceae bacterium]|nr:hypothetical protein [Lacipirellulaceae bacterium]